MSIGPYGQNEAWNDLWYPDKYVGWEHHPVRVQFISVPYESKTSKRENPAAPNAAGNMATITMPLPRDLQHNNSIAYSPGATETGGITDPTPGEIMEDVITGGGVAGSLAWAGAGAAIGSVIPGVGTAAGFLIGGAGLISSLWWDFGKDITGVSEFYGERPMDMRDSIFNGANFRRHSFGWTLVPKTVGEAMQVAIIANAFQTLAYPTKNVGSIQNTSKVLHPPMWHIAVMDMSGGSILGESKGSKNKQRWLMYPQLSVLANVTIKTRGSEGGPWMLGGRHNPLQPDVEMNVSIGGPFPAATQIGLSFVELEPAINIGAQVASRSLVKSESNTSGFYEHQGRI